MTKKLIFLIICIFGLNIKICALTYGGCEYSDVSRMKSLVNNVNIYYDYHMQDGEAMFDVTLTNITPEMRFIDSNGDRTYYYSDTNNGEIVISNYNVQSGNYKFYFDNYNCSNVKLGTKYYSFPVYNSYYENSECIGIEEFKLCQKWVSSYYSYDDFIRLTSEYRDNKYANRESKAEVQDAQGIFDVIIAFYVRYYYLILIPIIIIGFIVYLIVWRKTRFKL